jgi:hypothetical protein
MIIGGWILRIGRIRSLCIRCRWGIWGVCCSVEVGVRVLEERGNAEIHRGYLGIQINKLI